KAVSLLPGTNNVAEYYGILYGLKSSIDLGIRRVQLFSDSELAVKQIKGDFQVNSEDLRPLHSEIRSLIEELELFEISWIPREENTAADQLANLAIEEDAKEKPRVREKSRAKK